METRPYLLHALSPLHAGTGRSVGNIDLPIARMRSTAIPFIPGSSLKGVLRELHREWHGLEVWGEVPQEKQEALAEHYALFGPWRKKGGPEGDEWPTEGELDRAGALVVGDARLLALPVRSFYGTFALVTSPLLLRLARRDLEAVLGKAVKLTVPELKDEPCALVGSSSLNVHHVHSEHRDRVFLEELDLAVVRGQKQQEESFKGWVDLLSQVLPAEERELLEQRLMVVDDETMSFLWETATQVDTRVRIEQRKGTVAEGALWTEESLPAETLMVGVLAASPSHHKGSHWKASDVLTKALEHAEVLQLGGKATVGRGRCRLYTWPVGKAGKP